MSTELVFTLVGGPYDDSVVKVILDNTPPGAFTNLEHAQDGRLIFKKHSYRVVEFNPKTLEGVLMW